jgi:hypothetical protein
MSFNSTVLATNPELPAGELITDSVGNISAYDKFENDLRVGRFAKFDSGSIDNMDGSSTPVIAGIVARKITNEIGVNVYKTTGAGIDQVAEVINFGFATVTVTDAADPSRYGPVQVINADTAEAGKATDASVGTGVISAGDVVFWSQKAAKVWLVRINKFL